MEDPGLRVGGLTAAVVGVDVGTGGRAVERNVEGVDEHVRHGLAGVRHQHVDRVGVGRAVAGGVDVGSERLRVASGDGDAALCPVGRGVFGLGRLRRDEHVRPLAGGRQGGGTPGDTRSDDQHVGFAGHSSSIRSSAVAASSFSRGATATSL